MKNVLYFVACVAAVISPSALAAAEGTKCEVNIETHRSTIAGYNAQIAAGLVTDAAAEQLMVDHATALAALQLAKLQCSSMSAQGATTQKSATKTRVTKLEKQVASLTETVAKLTTENTALIEIISKLTASPKDEKADFNSLNCLDRKASLIEKLDSLKSLGFKKSHPDISNVERQLKKIEAECPA
ncbi:MAG: hypothetical protein JKY34_06075 [Kordiimonadaceae bacterium]|nr:hypothetical protein [Kordiimonadaceae bacterium]